MKSLRTSAAALRPARAAGLAYGHATSGRRMLSTLGVSGVQRRGTRLTYGTHAEHPQAPLAVLRQSVHCVDTDFGRGLDGNGAHSRIEATAQRLAEQSGAGAITGQSRPYCTFHQLAERPLAWLGRTPSWRP